MEYRHRNMNGFLVLIILLAFCFSCTQRMPKPETFPICLKVTVSDLSGIRQGYNGMAFLMKSGQSEVLVSGYLKKGLIYFDKLDVLGHEVVHVLNWEYPELITDPDTY